MCVELSDIWSRLWKVCTEWDTDLLMDVVMNSELLTSLVPSEFSLRV